MLRRMLDQEEFLSAHGVRSLSKYHSAHPYILAVNGNEYRVDYEPGESQSGLFRRKLELAWPHNGFRRIS